MLLVWGPHSENHWLKQQGECTLSEAKCPWGGVALRLADSLAQSGPQGPGSTLLPHPWHRSLNLDWVLTAASWSNSSRHRLQTSSWPVEEITLLQSQEPLSEVVQLISPYTTVAKIPSHACA